MKHVALLLSIVCLLVFVACGQGDKTEKATVSESEKATEMVKEKAEETTEMAIEQQGLVDRARVTFESLMADKNQSWLKENLNQAKGLIIIPSLLKAGFVIGGSGGSGVLIVKDDKTGQWSQPAFYTLGSGTLGLQIGVEAAEIIMMVLISGDFTALKSGLSSFGSCVNVLWGAFSFTQLHGSVRGAFV
jgi:lipid-binding SYLF domain-containing protein